MRGQDQQSGINPACLWLRKHGRRSFKKTVLGLLWVILYARNILFSSFVFQDSYRDNFQTFCSTFGFFIIKKLALTYFCLLRIVVISNFFANFPSNFCIPLVKYKHLKSYTFLLSTHSSAAPSPLPPFLSAVWNINNRMTGRVPVVKFSVPQMLDCLYSSALWI